MKNQRVVFFMPVWFHGGAEKVIVLLANQLTKLGYAVEIAVIYDDSDLRNNGGSSAEAYNTLLNKNIIFTKLRVKRPMRGINYIKRIMAIRNYIKTKTPDIVFSNLLRCDIILATILMKTHTQIIMIEHLSCVVYNMTQKILMKFLYPHADAIVCVSAESKKECDQLLPKICDKIYAIPNPVEIETREAAARPQQDKWQKNKEQPLFAAIGRLEQQKNFPLLLHAFFLVRQQIDATLVIAGCGSLDAQLKQMAIDLKIAEHVNFVGYIENPYPLFTDADVFVLSSDYEGFGLVIVEALTCGCQVVSTNCPCGPSEILNNGEFGWLSPVGDATNLSKSMIEALYHPKPNDLLRRRAADFSPEKASIAYHQLIQSL